MRTSAALCIVALAGTLAGCNHNKNHGMNDRNDRDSTRTTFRSDSGVVEFTGYDDRGGAVNSGPATVSASDWRPTDAGRGYDDRRVFGAGDGTTTVRSHDNHATGSSTYDDRSATQGGTTATNRDNWGTTTVAHTPDARILSILHCKNQEEIKLGRLAQRNGQAQDVKDYGEMLVRDHSANDARVLETARSAGITLMSDEQVKEMCAKEKGKAKPDKDAMAELRNKHGAEFDSAFSKKMEQGHEEAIAQIKDAQPKVQNSQVRMLLAETLPKLQQHEGHAEALAAVHDNDDR